MAKVCPSPSQREIITIGSEMISPKPTTSSGQKRKYNDPHHSHGGQHRFKRERIILPNRFLLGGNINDPLNLQSLADKTAHKKKLFAAGVSNLQQSDSPAASSSPSTPIQPNFNEPIEIKIPKDRRDPLNLEEKSPGSRRNRKRRRRTFSLKLSNEEDEAAMLSLIDHPVRPSSEMDILDGSVSDSEVMKISGSQVRFRSTQSRLSMDPISAIERTDVKLKSPAERPTSSARPTACVAAGGTEEKSQLGKRKSSGKVVDPIVSPVLNTSHVQRRSSFSAAKRKSDGSIPGVSRSFSPEKKLTEISPTAGKKKDKKRLKRRGGANRSRETAKDRVDKNLSIPAVPLKKDAEPQSTSTTADQTNPKATKFRYGNYSRYYGYRLPERSDDPRLSYFKPEWFEGKDVLDIGCNTGQVTSVIARDFHPRLITGIDIDPHLIGVARKNIRHYLDEKDVEVKKTHKFSPYFAKKLGPLAPAPTEPKPGEFPNNLVFRSSNYVLDNDALLASVREEFDVILALSITKWIHMNWGDDGIKRFFRRIYKNLRPNGVLILEPQPLPSYKKKKNITPEIEKNFHDMKFKPDQFTEYLLSREIGFSTSEVLGMPHTNSKGFSRPIYCFRKMELTQRSISDAIIESEKSVVKAMTTSAVVSVERPSDEAVNLSLDS